MKEPTLQTQRLVMRAFTLAERSQESACFVCPPFATRSPALLFHSETDTVVLAVGCIMGKL